MIRKIEAFGLIISFGDKRTAAFMAGDIGKWLPADLVRRTRRALQMIEAAEKLSDLMIPPGNRLESLSGNRKGQHLIRINDQWRVCFVWTESGTEKLEIVDYH
jgi:toxin HigB-1